MVEYGRGHQLPLHSTVGRMNEEHRERECNACKPMPHDYCGGQVGRTGGRDKWVGQVGRRGTGGQVRGEVEGCREDRRIGERGGQVGRQVGGTGMLGQTRQVRGNTLEMGTP